MIDWNLSGSQGEGQFEAGSSVYRTPWPTYVYLQKFAGHPQFPLPQQSVSKLRLTLLHVR
jgi:hypothetical protein